MKTPLRRLPRNYTQAQPGRMTLRKKPVANASPAFPSVQKSVSTAYFFSQLLVVSRTDGAFVRVQWVRCRSPPPLRPRRDSACWVDMMESGCFGDDECETFESEIHEAVISRGRKQDGSEDDGWRQVFLTLQVGQQIVMSIKEPSRFSDLHINGRANRQHFHNLFKMASVRPAPSDKWDDGVPFFDP